MKTLGGIGVAFSLLGIIALGIALIEPDIERARAISWFVSGPFLLIGVVCLLAKRPV